MPPRVIQAKTPPSDPAQVGRLVGTMAGFFDDPIVQVRASWGAFASDKRRLRMEVIDRLASRYPPTAFRNARGLSPGRWWVAFYFSTDEHGAPVAPTGVVAVTGRVLTPMNSQWYLGITDRSGVLEADVEKVSPGDLWVMHGVPVLMRSLGIDWVSGGEGENGAGDPPAGPPPVSEGP